MDEQPVKQEQLKEIPRVMKVEIMDMAAPGKYSASLAIASGLIGGTVASLASSRRPTTSIFEVFGEVLRRNEYEEELSLSSEVILVDSKAPDRTKINS